MRRPRDFRYAGWHSLSAGDPGSMLYFEATPSVSSYSRTAVTVTFTTNVPTNAYMEWAYNEDDLGTANGWTNSPGETSFDYSTHTQTATSLSPATSYYLRVIVEDAGANSLTSSPLSFTTYGDIAPPIDPNTIGPRYDLYDGVGGGTYPALGTEPSGGTAVAWTDSNVYVVPNSVATASDVASALITWITDTVPDGASAASPSYIVFDRSHDGEDSTQYGAGTSYTLNKRIILELADSGVKRSNLCFWGYNAQLDFTGLDSYGFGLLGFERGGWENVYVLGFDFDGPGTTDITVASDGFNGAAEQDIGVNVTSFSGIKMMDCYVHHASQGFSSREWGLGASGGNAHYDGWSHGPYANDAEVAYNEFAQGMNQGILINGGWNIDIHHNYVHDHRQKLIDLEDNNRNYIGSLARRIVNITIRENRFGDWQWQAPDPEPPQAPWGVISFEHRDYDGVLGIDSYENVEITDNYFAGQPRGMGNPDSEILYNGYSETLQQESLVQRGVFAIAMPPNWQRLVTAPKPGVTITGNVSSFPQWMVDLDGVSRVWGYLANATDVTITDNDFQGMDWTFYDVTLTEWTRNGDSTYQTL